MQPNDTEKDTPKDKKSKWSVLTVFIWFRLQRYKKKCICARKKIKYFILRDYFTTIETTCGAIVRRSRSFERKWDKNFLPRSRNIFNNNINVRRSRSFERMWDKNILRAQGRKTPTESTNEHIFVAPCPLGRNLIKSFGTNIRPLSSVLRNKLPPALRSRSRLNLN